MARTGYLMLFGREDNIPEWVPSYEGFYIDETSISSDGSFIAAGGVAFEGVIGKVCLFSRNNNTPLWEYEVIENNSIVRSVSISSDGSHIAVGDTDGKVYLFSKDNNSPLWSYKTGGNVSVAISSDGNYIVAWTTSPDFKVYFFGRELPTEFPTMWVVVVIVVVVVAICTVIFVTKRK